MRHVARALIAVLLLAAAPLAVRAQDDTTRVGSVAALTGPVAVLRAGTPRALIQGAAVHRDDRIVTLADAKLRIVFTDGAELVVGSDSKVAIARYAPETGSAVMQLLHGILRAVVPADGRWTRFDVETRMAVASARSTQWVVVLSGEGTDVARDSPPAAVKRWGQGRADAVLARTRLR